MDYFHSMNYGDFQGGVRGQRGAVQQLRHGEFIVWMITRKSGFGSERILPLTNQVLITSRLETEKI